MSNTVIVLAIVAAVIVMVGTVVFRKRTSRRRSAEESPAADSQELVNDLADQQYQELREEIETLLPKLIEEEERGSFKFANDVTYRPVKTLGGLESRVGALPSHFMAGKQELRNLIDEVKRFAVDRVDYEHNRKELSEAYTAYAEASSLDERVRQLENLQGAFYYRRDYTRKQLAEQWEFDTSTAAITKLLEQLVRERLAELKASATTEAGVLELFEFRQKWWSVKGVRLPKDWVELVTKYVTVPTLDLYMDTGHAKFAPGELRDMAAKAIQDRDLTAVKHILARVNHFTGNREDVGEPLVADLEMLKHKLHKQRYPELHAD